MFSKILVPLDGSEVTERILPFVSLLARGLDTPVALLSVLEGTTGTSDSPRRGWLKTLEEEAGRRLGSVAERIAKTGVRAETSVVFGEPASEILRVADRQACDLIAMFHHGMPQVARGVLGSVTDKVVHLSSRPVITLAPDRAEMYAGQRAVSKALSALREPEAIKIMVPLDGSALSETVLPYVEELARKLSARVLLVRVVRPARVPNIGEDSDEADEQQRAAERAAGTYLSRTAERLTTLGLDAGWQVLTGQPAISIIQFLHGSPQDIVAMSTRGRAAWALGSVAEALLRDTGDPVLMVAPDREPVP